MKQSYHTNAKTNIHNRQQIQNNFSLSNRKIAENLNISSQTVSKWRNRDFQKDISSCPKTIKYSLSELETALVLSIRSSSWLPLDEVFEMLQARSPFVSRSSIYRCFVRCQVSQGC
jgi:IS30 family transposase